MSTNRRRFLHSLLGAVGALSFGNPFRKSKYNDENRLIWTTQDGREIMIADLTDDHLRHIIFYMNKRYGHLYPDRIDGGTPADRGLGSPFAGANYDIMRREANRRKLTWI